ncbi:MAG: DUF192 domain-containing protein [Deltaproteobacteria bacterium]|nr:DUF192 domain-containing protein [Deltaproteobacteria bacterium]
MKVFGSPLIIGPCRYRVIETCSSRERIKGLYESDGSTALVISFPFRFRWAIWMRGMATPLDLVWMDRGRVVGVTKRSSPHRWSDRWRMSLPPQKIDAVFEIPGRHTSRHGDCFLIHVVEQWWHAEKESSLERPHPS